MKSGIDVVLDLIKLDDHIKDQDLIVTGEGRMDNQTAFGKTPVGVSMAGKRHGGTNGSCCWQYRFRYGSCL